MNAALWRALPPVGEPIRLRRNGESPSWRISRQAIYLQSGTAALAQLLAGVTRRARARGTAASEVLLPAYGCPDIVSAVAYAGLRPRLVDLAPDSPFPSPENWRAAIGTQTLALVTVGFLGMRDSFGPESARAAGLTGGGMIEDCCQVHPMAIAGADSHSLALSFGRGKPVSLMHGGAAIPSDKLREWLPPMAPAAGEWRAFVRLALTTRLYNLLRSPMAYGWVTRLPGIGVGGSRYQMLGRIKPMNGRVLACLDVRSGWNEERRRKLQQRLCDALAGVSRRVLRADLWQKSGAAEDWLLRYPLLFATRDLRDAAWRRLNAAGLGASPMYGQPLARFAGIGEMLDPSELAPRAQEFADRLLTLPLHVDVTDADVDAIHAVISGLERA